MSSSMKKQNAKGELLAGWRRVRLGDIFNIQTGKSQRDKINNSGEFIVIDMGGVSTDGKLIEKKKILYSEHFLQIDDLVMPKDDIGHGYILGKVAIIKKSNKYVLGDHAFGLRNSSPNSPDFLRILINSPSVNNSLKRKANGTSQKGLTQKEVFNHLVLLPDLEKQKQIASVIYTWDDAIEKTELLIAAQERQLAGIVNKLLNNSNQVTGWRKAKISEIGHLYSGLYSKNKGDFGKGKPYIPYKNVYQNPIIDPSKVEYVKVEQSEKQNKIMKNDILFTLSSETPEEVGVSSLVLGTPKECYLNSFCFGLRLSNNTIYPRYLAYYFRSNNFTRLTRKIAQGSTRYNISKKVFSELDLFYPNLNKQKEIVSILSTLDKAIEKNKIILKKYKSQKKGIIQQIFEL